MFKQLAHKLSSVVLAIIVLFSSVSFSVDKHFCAGNLIDVSIITSVERCKGDMKEGNENHSKGLIKSCCKDVREIVEGVDVLNTKPSPKYASPDYQFIQNNYFELIVYLDQQIGKQNVFKSSFGPPNKPNLQVLYQSFLI